MLLFEDIIEQYESAVAERGWNEVDLREFIPHADSPHYWETLVELLRVRMEHQIAAGDLQGVQRCVNEYPALRSQETNLSLLAFEEYRLLNSAGFAKSPLEYEKQWQVDVTKWDLEGNEYHLTEDDWQKAIEREATLGRFSAAVDSARPNSTPPGSTRPNSSKTRFDKAQFNPTRATIDSEAPCGAGSRTSFWTVSNLG